MGKTSFSTLQASEGVNGDYSSSDSTFNGLGVGIYVGVTGDVTIETIGAGNNDPVSVLYTGVPQGSFMQVPMFKKVLSSGTTSTDLTIAFLAPPYR